jgi:hypothetical protein
MKVTLSLKHARALLSVWTDEFGDFEPNQQAAFVALQSALAPRPKSSAVKRTEARKKSKREETAAIREAVFARAGGRCEMHDQTGLRCGLPAEEMDHFFGRGRAKQTVQNCWALCCGDHRNKTLNRPGGAYWFERFAEHARRHGYLAEAARADRESSWRTAKKAAGGAP